MLETFTLSLTLNQIKAIKQVIIKEIVLESAKSNDYDPIALGRLMRILESIEKVLDEYN